MRMRTAGLLSVAIAAVVWLPVWAGAKGHAKAPDVKAIYTSHCAGCHGDKMQGGIGPALTHEGKKRSYKWLVVQINDPDKHEMDPKEKHSRMPSAAAMHLSAAQVKAAAMFLSKLK